MNQIAYITDIHLDDSWPIESGADPRRNWKTILADVRSRNIRDIILGGDIGEPVSHEWLFESLRGFNIDLALGNHDSYQEIIKYYPKHSKGTKELYYSYEKGNFKFIFLDSSSSWIVKHQLEWLQEELKTPRKVLLFVHHPVLPVNTPVDKAYPLFNRDAVQKVLTKSLNDIIVFAGHYHVSDEARSGNIAQYVTPAASVQLVKDAPIIKTDTSCFGYRLLTIHDDKVEVELILF